MVNIALVENEDLDSSALESALKEYSRQRNCDFSIECFKNALSFLGKNYSNYDIAFLDILMPEMNGMELAEAIRKTDSKLLIVFITNLANFAIKGYSVNAFDFIVKPFNKVHLFRTLDKLIKAIENKKDSFITLKNKSNVKVVDLDQIDYLEIDWHLITYYLTDNSKFDSWGILKDEIKRLPPDRFIRINSNTVINARKIANISGNQIIINQAKLYISRGFKKEAMDRIFSFYGNQA